jgi:hypothetical protein
MTARHGRKHAPERVTRTRCATCRRFARRLVGQTECNCRLARWTWTSAVPDERRRAVG